MMGPIASFGLPGGMFDENRAIIPWIEWTQIYSYRTPTAGMVGLHPLPNLARDCGGTACSMYRSRIIEMYDPVTSTLLGTVGPMEYSAGDKLPEERFPGGPHRGQ